jgi:hypothetical protein
MHADGLLCAGHGVTRSFSASRLDARLAASLKDGPMCEGGTSCGIDVQKRITRISLNYSPLAISNEVVRSGGGAFDGPLQKA